MLNFNNFWRSFLVNNRRSAINDIENGFLVKLYVAKPLRTSKSIHKQRAIPYDFREEVNDILVREKLSF